MDLPSDAIVEILTWLPVKALLKFKCVCKSWQTLISSQQFARAHLQNSKLNRNFSIIGGYEGKFYQCSVNSLLYESASEQFDLPNPFGSKSVMVVGSCNGLLCLSISQMYFILWNPSTRIWKSLPTVEEEDIWESLYSGFGFVESSGDYKVVGIFYKRKKIVADDMMVQVYSLRNDEWKRIKNSAKAGWRTFGPASFVNGKLYWVVLAKDKVEGGCVFDIVSFDLEKEEDGRLRMPSGVNEGASAVLGVSGDSLVLSCSHRTRADVWIMGGCSAGNERNWTKLATIPLTSDLRNWIRCMKVVYVENGRILVFCGIRKGFLVFDAKDCSITYPEGSADFQTSDFYNVAIYLESLVSPLGKVF